MLPAGANVHAARDPDDAAPPRTAIRRALLGFYDRERRELPWRAAADPYATLVSEVMLQQTRVAMAVPYYERWMDRFPDVASLAEAPEEEVLTEWAGLGYYSRARNLHRAARVVRERHGGSIPASVPELRALPGVGEYTAGAVASIAFDVRVPAVDGNARRVLSRLFDLDDGGAARVRARAADLVDGARPGDLNQAIMELGARVCTPRAPVCGECPVRRWCLARLRGTVELRPARQRRPPVRSVSIATLVAVRTDPDGAPAHGWMVRRDHDGPLAGMWEFPGAELRPGEPAAAALGRLARSPDHAPDAGGIGPVPLPPIQHAFSHLRIRYLPFLVEIADGRRPSGSEHAGREHAEEAVAAAWVPLQGAAGKPLPAAQRRIRRSAAAALRQRAVEDPGGAPAGHPGSPTRHR